MQKMQDLACIFLHARSNLELTIFDHCKNIEVDCPIRGFPAKQPENPKIPNLFVYTLAELLVSTGIFLTSGHFSK